MLDTIHINRISSLPRSDVTPVIHVIRVTPEPIHEGMGALGNDKEMTGCHSSVTPNEHENLKNDASDKNDSNAPIITIEKKSLHITSDSKVVKSSEQKSINDPTLGNLDNEPLDYKSYILRQKKVFDAEEPKVMARLIFDELASKSVEANPRMEKRVLEQEYREALISSGFSTDDIDVIIKGMESDKLIERVGTELDGVFCDILRVIN